MSTSMAGAVAERPDRMTITDLVSGESVEMQYNPTEIEEGLAVVYGKLTIPGQSHTIGQYTNTGPLGVTFDLAFDALANAKDFDWDDAMNARNFLHSLCYAKRGAGSVRAGAPPRCLFVWPNLYSLTTRIQSLKIRFTRFAKNGKPTAFSCSCVIEEIRDMRLTSEDVLDYGTQRSPDAPRDAGEV